MCVFLVGELCKYIYVRELHECLSSELVNELYEGVSSESMV